jgi:2-polyprenyl-3-methyl-5-hydroxy-6-metoxy-1,4-benzoquinol methylase
MKTLRRCPVCDSKAIGLSFTGSCERRPDGKRWEVHKCHICGLGFLNPQPEWQDLQEYYGITYHPYQAEHGLSGFEETVEEARRTGGFRHIRITKGLRILDVGCGGGAFIRVAEALGATAQGVEPSVHGVKIARGHGLSVFRGHLDEFLAGPAGESRYDVITANHVIEHHPQPVELLRQMKALLAPGGYIWFAVPNAQSATALVLREHWHSTDLPYHLLQFTPGSAGEVVTRAGLEVTHQHTYSLPAAVAASLVAILRRKLLVPTRFSSRLPLLDRIAARKALNMDRQGVGEAIIVEARDPAN